MVLTYFKGLVHPKMKIMSLKMYTRYTVLVPKANKDIIKVVRVTSVG